MKHSLLLLLCVLTLLAPLSGCISFGGKGRPPVPRYMVLVERPSTTKTSVKKNALPLIIGRIRASERCSTPIVSWVNLLDGRAGTIRSGRLAEPPQTVVHNTLREWLQEAQLFSFVSEAAVAPLQKEYITLEGWVERFDLECNANGAWYAVVEAHFFVSRPNARIQSFDVKSRIPITIADAATQLRPLITDIIPAFRSALIDSMQQLENGLIRYNAAISL